MSSKMLPTLCVIAEPKPIKNEVNSRAERLFDLFENFL